jgi:DNA-binding NtrC family response regulator
MNDQIFFVDDDVDLLESYSEILQLLGYNITTFSNGKDALEMYKKNKPALVFSDIKMPEMDGYELFSRIIDFDQDAKVILITGHENKEKSVIAKNNGLMDIFYKPVIDDEIESAIKSAIAKNDC